MVEHPDIIRSPERVASRPHRFWRGFEVNWGAALLAGLIAGTAFLALELLASWWLGADTPVGPAHVTLHGFIGAEQSPAYPNVGLIAAAVVLHYILSMLLAIPLAALVHPWRQAHLVVAVAAVFGCILYFINVQMLDPLAPLLGAPRDLFMLVNYTLFGITTAWSYKEVGRRLGAQITSP